jgi:hypothetical protein
MSRRSTPAKAGRVRRSVLNDCGEDREGEPAQAHPEQGEAPEAQARVVERQPAVVDHRPCAGHEIRIAGTAGPAERQRQGGDSRSMRAVATAVEHDGQSPGEEQVEVAARQIQGPCLARREPLGVLVSKERVEPTLLCGGAGRAPADERLALGDSEESDPDGAHSGCMGRSDEVPLVPACSESRWF